MKHPDAMQPNPYRPPASVPAVAATASLAMPGPAVQRPVDGGGGRAGASLAEVCWRRRWTVAASVAVSLAAAAVYMAKAPRVYTPAATLYVDENGLRLLGADKAQSAADAESYLVRQSELIRSERVVRQAIDDYGPARVGLMYPRSTDPVGDVRGALDVSVGKKDDVITVALSCPQPAGGAALVNAIVAAYQAFESHQAHATASDAVRILQREKEKQEQALDEKQRQIVACKQANGEMFFANDHGTNILIQNLATISDQVTRARLYAAARHALYASDPTVLTRRAWRQAEDEADELDRLYDREKTKALKINAALAEYQKLQADADRTTKQCDLLDARIRELDVTQQGGPDIQVLEAAKVEARPTSPKKTAALATALAGGLLAGCGLAALRDAADQRLRTASQAARVLGVAALGVLPDVPRSGDRLPLARAVQLAPDSAFAAAVASLAAEVCFGRPFRDGCSLVVTSPGRGDGKTTTAANLAVAAAHAGRRTLLVDADLRRPGLHHAFDMHVGVGLADAVAAGLGIDQVVRPTAVRGLSLMTAGTPAASPVEVVGSAAFGDLLKRLADRFDLIVIDAPPLLGGGEARVLAAQADAAVLVLRAERATRSAARLACDRVAGVGCHLLGFAFNHGGSAAGRDDGPPAPERRAVAGRPAFAGDRPAPADGSSRAGLVLAGDGGERMGSGRQPA